MILDETYILTNSVHIPKVALGTWLMTPEQAKTAVGEALDLGYRHVDTAQAYGNEAAVGQAVRDSGIPRDQIFVTSKVKAEYKDHDSAAKSIEESLKTMGLDYLDLMLIHAPQPWADFRDSDNRFFPENKQVWKALEEAYDQKLVRSIGVSNFLIDDLENILAGANVQPMVNQILAHITNTPLDVINFCDANLIRTEAYSPIGHGDILTDPDLVAMAEKYKVTVPQLCIRYVLQLGMVALPKATSYDHIKSNAELDFVIGAEDMGTLMHLPPIKTYGDDDKWPVFGKGTK